MLAIQPRPLAFERTADRLHQSVRCIRNGNGRICAGVRDLESAGAQPDVDIATKEGGRANW